MEIHVLKAQGLSERQIARQLGISRNTVARYLESEETPRYKMRDIRPTKLDPFKAYVEQRVREAAPDWIPAPAMMRELTALGYGGQIRRLQDFMRTCKPVARHDPVVRFETQPGQQLQCDFVVFRRGRHPLYAFTATLGYSRWRWVRFASDESTATLVSCHHAMFSALGGVPREVLYDNAKSIVIKRDAYGEGSHRWNDDFLDVAKLYGYLPRLCRPYRARTKGKVERFHRYLRGNFYVPLSSRMKASGLPIDAQHVVRVFRPRRDGLSFQNEGPRLLDRELCSLNEIAEVGLQEGEVLACFSPLGRIRLFGQRNGSQTCRELLEQRYPLDINW